MKVQFLLNLSRLIMYQNLSSSQCQVQHILQQKQVLVEISDSLLQHCLVGFWSEEHMSSYTLLSQNINLQPEPIFVLLHVML